jgi:hypothetical protein
MVSKKSSLTNIFRNLAFKIYFQMSKVKNFEIIIICEHIYLMNDVKHFIFIS